MIRILFEVGSLATHYIIGMLLAQNEIEIWMVMIRLNQLGLEHNHDTVLKEVIVLQWVGVEILCFKIVNPAATMSIGNKSVELKTNSFSGRSTWKQITSPS
jgi:hypothetical protein